MDVWGGAFGSAWGDSWGELAGRRPRFALNRQRPDPEQDRMRRLRAEDDEILQLLATALGSLHGLH